jgi:hypothetical protein
MPDLRLPAQFARLSSAGFDRLYRLVREDRDLARAVAKAVEEDPRSALHHAFRLTKNQKLAIENTTDEELRRRASQLIGALRSDEPGALHFDPGPRPKPGGGRIDTCGCDIGPRPPPPPPPK